MHKKIITNSPEETTKTAEEFARELLPGSVVCLYGDLGVGKTTFTAGFAKGLEITERILSPTFSIIREYTSETKKIKLYHLDLYRLESIEEIKGIGIFDILDDKQSIIVIEWADKLQDLLPKHRIDIHITQYEYGRQIEIRKI
jgi:tRNA threonylcarbamoyladenosine biosynthesis protein TsaE